MPDLEIDDSSIYPGEFGTTTDQLSYLALDWIKRGKKPVLQASASTRGGVCAVETFGDLWDNRPVQPRGGAVMQPRWEE